MQNGSNTGTSGAANALVNTAAAEAAGPSNSKVPLANGGQSGQTPSAVLPVQSKATMVASPGKAYKHC
jgi:hypothetical protein